MTKIGDHTVVLEKSVEHATDEDAYGNPVKGRVYLPIRWCSFTPGRSSEPNDRNSPATSGATLIAPAGLGLEIESADAILYPWTRNDDGTYTGRRWEVQGDVGMWDESTECLLRRLT